MTTPAERFTNTVDRLARERAERPEVTLLGKLATWNDGRGDCPVYVADVYSGCDDGWHERVFAEVIRLGAIGEAYLNEALAFVDRANVDDLRPLDEEETIKAMAKYSVELGLRFPESVGKQAGFQFMHEVTQADLDRQAAQAAAAKLPLTRDELRAYLADFAAEIAIDIDREALDWSERTEAVAERLAVRLGVQA